MVGWGSSSLIPATMGKSPYAVGVYIFRSLEVGENGSSFQTWIMKVAPTPNLSIMGEKKTRKKPQPD